MREVKMYIVFQTGARIGKYRFFATSSHPAHWYDQELLAYVKDLLDLDESMAFIVVQRSTVAGNPNGFQDYFITAFTHVL
jgi:hypothetical protein